MVKGNIMNLFIIFAVLSVASIAIMGLDKLVLATVRAGQANDKPPFYIAVAYAWGPLVIMVFVVLLLVRYFNFTLILTLATLISLLVVIINRIFFVPKRRAAVKAYQEATTDPDEEIVKSLQQGPAIIEFTRSLFPVLLIVFILRSFIVEPFQIPSGSMKPTLGVGDFILVNKFAYGIKLPVINKTIIPIGQPQRGDVMVFHYPPNPNIDFIKRVVAIPGDKIQYTDDKQLLINGQPLETSFVKQVHEQENYEVYNSILQTIVTAKEDVAYKLYQENLLGIKHSIYQRADKQYIPYKANSEWIVPEGYYFMMGDNRDNSKDSRFWIEDLLKQQLLATADLNKPVPQEQIILACSQSPQCHKILNDDRMYMVPAKNIVGKAFMVWMHWPDPKLKNVPSFTDDRLIR